MNNVNNNNGNLLMYNLLSDSVKRCLEMYRNGRVSDAMKSQSFWVKIAQLDTVLKSVTTSYPTVTVTEDKSVNFYHGFKFFVVHSYQQARKLIASHLYKAKEVEERFQLCLSKDGNCSRDCNRCNLYARYGRPRIWVYVFGDKDPVRLCDPERGYPIDQDVIDAWYEMSEVSQEFFDELAAQERSATMNALLRTETPWLGYPTLKDLYHDCGSWERFMDIVDATTESINSEGVWDVEMTTSMVSREGSCLFTTTKAENGSTALSPKRMVYVENPKSRIHYEVLPADRINLFLSLTFYKYAGFQPMRPVVEVSRGDGYTDYVINDGSFDDDEGRGTSLLVTDETVTKDFEFKINFFEAKRNSCYVTPEDGLVYAKEVITSRSDVLKAKLESKYEPVVERPVVAKQPVVTEQPEVVCKKDKAQRAACDYSGYSDVVSNLGNNIMDAIASHMYDTIGEYSTARDAARAALVPVCAEEINY